MTQDCSTAPVWEKTSHRAGMSAVTVLFHADLFFDLRLFQQSLLHRWTFALWWGFLLPALNLFLSFTDRKRRWRYKEGFTGRQVVRRPYSFALYQFFLNTQLLFSMEGEKTQVQAEATICQGGTHSPASLIQQNTLLRWLLQWCINHLAIQVYH